LIFAFGVAGLLVLCGVHRGGRVESTPVIDPNQVLDETRNVARGDLLAGGELTCRPVLVVMFQAPQHERFGLVVEVDGEPGVAFPTQLGGTVLEGADSGMVYQRPNATINGGGMVNVGEGEFTHAEPASVQGVSGGVEAEGYLPFCEPTSVPTFGSRREVVQFGG
jgi:hypothetical protein